MKSDVSFSHFIFALFMLLAQRRTKDAAVNS